MYLSRHLHNLTHANDAVNKKVYLNEVCENGYHIIMMVMIIYKYDEDEDNRMNLPRSTVSLVIYNLFRAGLIHSSLTPPSKYSLFIMS